MNEMRKLMEATEGLDPFGVPDSKDDLEKQLEVAAHVCRNKFGLPLAADYIEHVLAADYSSLDRFDPDDPSLPMMLRRQAESIDEADGNRLEYPTTVEKVPDELDQVFWGLQRDITSVSYKAQQAASFIKKNHPEEKEKYNLAVDLEMELDLLRRRIFEIR